MDTVFFQKLILKWKIPQYLYVWHYSLVIYAAILVQLQKPFNVVMLDALLLQHKGKHMFLIKKKKKNCNLQKENM